MFEGLMNKHEGSKAYVLGAGPSLDNFTQPDDGLVIGVNDVGKRFTLDYVVSTDGYVMDGKTFLSEATVRLIALPYRHKDTGNLSHSINPEDEWFLHCHDIRRDGCAARLTKEQVRDTRWLYTASSSIQPAIHLAWYLGCTSMQLVGVDGGSGQATGLEHDHAKPGIYDYMIPDTVAIANRCFGKNWTR
jgi:hypothetical protein